MNSLLLLAIFSSLLYLIGFIPYIYHVSHGRVVPHPFSWTIWCLFSLTSGYFILLSEWWFSYAFIPIGIRSIALIVGSVIWWFYIRKISLNILDYLALFLGILAIATSHILGINQTIFFMIVIDFLILFPSLKKIWIDPKSEDIFAWIFAWLSQIFLIFTLAHLTFSTAGYYFYTIIINISVAFYIYRRKLYMLNYKYLFQKLLDFFVLKKKIW